MDLEVTNFIRKTISDKKPSLKKLIEYVSEKYQTKPVYSDLSFITDQYRLTLTKLWTEEFVQKFTESEINDEEVIELLETFRGLKAFDKTPQKLQGTIYKLIENQKVIFISKDFVKPRREICNVLTNKIVSFGQKTLNEYEFFKNIIDVLRNSYNQFEAVVAKLKLQLFVDGRISFYSIAQNVNANNFSIEKYEVLKEIATKIENKKPQIQKILQREIGKYLMTLISEEIESGEKKTWIIQRKVLTSTDLNANFASDVKEIHIICDILHIDQDLPTKYRGKNVFLMAKTTRLHQQSIWNLSGYNAQKKYSQNAGQYPNGDGKNGGNGEPGESGGNCEIFSTEINNATLWTIQSNGGNGSDGQDGGNGENGVNGQDVVKEDFTFNQQEITKDNFIRLLKDIGIDTENGSKYFTIYENNLQKHIVFNRSETKSEFLMLIKGSTGSIGALGGFGGLCGRSGFAGKINIQSDDKGFKTIAYTGFDGINGKNGFIGLKSRDGSDAFVMMSSDTSNTVYGGLNRNSKYEIVKSDRKKDFSIFYDQIKKYLVIQLEEKVPTYQAVRNTSDQHGSILASNDEEFYNSLVSVIKNANLQFEDLIEKFKVKEFCNNTIDLKEFASLIANNNFEIPNYNILKALANLFTIRSSKLETQIQNFLSDFTTAAKISAKLKNIYEIKRKLLTSEDLNGITEDFDELHVICDTLYVNENLARKFRGRNMLVTANTINIYQSIEWNISGHDDFLAIKANCSESKCFENGGHCFVNCNLIINPSLLKIISNGGDASQARNGTEAQIKDFTINGRSADELTYPMKQRFAEEGFVKYLIKESNDNYMILVKGQSARTGYKNVGEKGGLSGYVEIKAPENSNPTDEIDIIQEVGNDDISMDGSDAVMCVKNGNKQYLGLNQSQKYDFLSSSVLRENSFKFSSLFYYPKLSKIVSKEIRPDSVGISLCDNIIWVLRNSNENFLTFVTNFGLQEFVNGEISLEKVARNINSKYIKINCSESQLIRPSRVTSLDGPNIGNYANLMTSAVNFIQCDDENLVRNKIKEFIKPAEVQTTSNIITIKKKIFSSYEFGSITINIGTNEIRLICDTLDIHTGLPDNFRGKNLAIVANYVNVHRNVKWDLSGEQVAGSFSSDAGTSPWSGTGINGTDGTAGKSGGNFSLYCKIIDNSAALTIISNGSDATDGQNGGNGTNGIDGEDAGKSSFKINDNLWKMSFDLVLFSIKLLSFNLKSGYYYKTLDDGFSAKFFIQEEYWGIMYVQGKSGTKGKMGGLPGYGGQGGYAGKVNITTTDSTSQIRVSTQNSGSDGRCGKPGYNGVDGRNGEDVWMFGQKNWFNPEVYGKDKGRKFKESWSSIRESNSIMQPNGNYVTYVDDGSVYISSVRQRNNSKLTREREYKALATENASININTIINQHSSYFSDSTTNFHGIMQTQSKSRINVQNDIRSSMNELVNTNRNYFQTNSYKVQNDFKLSQKLAREPVKKSDILTQSSIEQHLNYLDDSTSEMEKKAMQYSSLDLEIEQEQVQVQTQIQIQLKFDPKKSQENIKVINSGRILYYDVLKMLTNGCDADNLMKVLQKSRFNSDKYKYLAKNVDSFKIRTTARKIQDRNTILNSCIQNYIKICGKDSKNPEVLSFYDQLSKNDLEWKKCIESSQVLEKFWSYIEDTQPGVILDFLKNQLGGSQLASKELSKFCDEKFYSKFFEGVYLKIRSVKTQESKSTIAFENTDFWDQVTFLKDTKSFKSDTESLNRHFVDKKDDQKKEILEYFKLNAQNFDLSLPEAVFKILVKHADELKDIQDIVHEYSTKSSDVLYEYDSNESENSDSDYDYITTDDDINMIDMNIEANHINMRNMKKEKYVQVINEFYTNDKIIKFIKNDIETSGINSLLYRCILAHKYNKKFTIFVQSFDGDLKVVENHNYGYYLEFEYKNRDDELMVFSKYPTPVQQEELFIILKNGIFTQLDFNSIKYEAFKIKQKLGKQSETTVKILSDDKVNESDKIEVMEYLNPIIQKYQAKNNKLLNVFKDTSNLVPIDTTIDIILSCFPCTLLRYDENGVTQFTIDDKIDENIIKFNEDSTADGSIVKYKIHNDQELRNDIKSDLSSIANMNGCSIVTAFAVRLFNDENSQTLREFSLILKTILDLLSQQKSFQYFLTILILGNHQELWSLELALLILESINGNFNEDLKRKWRASASKTNVQKILELFLEKVSELEENDDLDEDKVDHIMDNIQYFEADDYGNLKNSSLSSWRLMTTKKYWDQELSKLKLKNVKNEELTPIFEDLSSKFGIKAKNVLQILQNKKRELHDVDLEGLLKDFNSGKFKISEKSQEILKTEPAKEWISKLQKLFSTESGIRKADDIIRLVEMDQESSQSIKNNIRSISHQAQDVFQVQRDDKKIVDYTEAEIKEWIKQVKNGSIRTTMIESLATIVRMFQIKKKITLRDTQLMSILTMWSSYNGVLMQVSTGEGKTFIGVSFAILKVLKKEKVDIITSSSVLAVRDAQENKEFFDFFEISVDHNCHEDMEKRKQAYGCEVVYGVLGNFQRDYLLTEFFDENFMSGHHFTNVLVDEVDSMLLDKGNNILYLSSSLPDIDEIESVFVFIWHYVNQGSNDPEEAEALLQSGLARKIILDNAYGLLEKADLENMKPEVDADDVLNKLKNYGIIDDEFIICDENYVESRLSNALFGFDEEFVEKVKVFCKNKIESEKMMSIPKYLKKFVLLHLSQWIENAVRAKFLTNQKEYIVDKPTASGPYVSGDPNVIILDLDTGTDMTNSQWDEGLHQFLQLKHGCRLSLISLKSVFISNVTYFKKYKKLYGMTGTLGNIEERKKTTEIHQIDFVTFPRYNEQRFQEYPSILESDPSKWIKQIYEEVVNRFKENRSVLIICETIQDTTHIEKVLLNNSSTFSESNVHVYQRDAADFNLGKLNPKHVIVATNLAGRGTDIKLSNELKQAGGLHVILAYLPQNTRIENQAFGRASRAGDMGSARLIICTDSTEKSDIAKLKESRNHNELQRLDEVNSYYQNFITIEEFYFQKFHSAYRELKQAGVKKTLGEEIIITGKKRKMEPIRIHVKDNFLNNYRGFNDSKGTDAIQIYLENFKLQWSFWLDENSKKLEQRRAKKHNINDIRQDLNNSFNNFLAKAPDIHPVNQIELLKFHVVKDDFKKAKEDIMSNFRDDSIAFQYFKCFEMLKSRQLQNDHSNRKITSDEKRELIKCMKMLNSRIHSRNVRIEIVNSIKDQYQDSLVSIVAYEKQQKALNEIDEMFIDSLQSILGRPIMPSTLETTEIKLNFIKNCLHEELIKQNGIVPSQIYSYYTDADIRNASESSKIRYEDLKNFIAEYDSSYISCIKDFGEKVKKSINIPSREEFWTTLITSGILTNEVEYAVIDLNVLKDIDPSLYAELEEAQKYIREKLATSGTSKKTEIFFTNINSVNEDKGQFIMPLIQFKSKLSDERYNFLMENGVMQINKRANFDLHAYEKIRYQKIFDNFDEITQDDFSQICKKYEKIFKKLTQTYENDVQILTQRGTAYALNYKNINLIDPSSESTILEDDEVYQKSILDLINHKFAYRIALEKLANRVTENVKNNESSVNLIIHLEVSPHLGLVNQLFTNNVIEYPQVDNEKLTNVSKIKSILKEDEFVIRALGTASTVFPKTATINHIKRHIKNARDDFKSIEERIKESIQGLMNADIEKPDVVLKPLKDYLTTVEHQHMIEHLKQKGFDMIIKIEIKKYTSTYWFRFSMVMLIAIIQIVIGAIIIIMSKGSFYKVGEAFIQEGISDAIFALGTLKSGHFTWKDYGMHKLISVITTVAFFGASYGLSKVKFAKKYLKEAENINQHILSNLKDKSTTVFQMLKSSGKIAQGTRKDVFKLFANTVASNVGKAFTQAAIGMGADFAMEAFLNETTKRISEYIVEQLQGNFWTSDLRNTIESLLDYYKPADLKEKILKEFKGISDSQQFWTDIAEKVSDKVDDLIRTGQNIPKIITITTSIVAKLLEMSSVTLFALNIFNHLNSNITKILRAKINSDKIENKLNNDDVKKFEQEILDQLKVESTEKFKNAVNSTAIKPAISFAANSIVNVAKQSVGGFIEKRKEKKYSKETAKIIENSDDGKISEASAKKVNKILAKSKNPVAHAALVELDIPINYIGIQAAAKVLEQKFGNGHKIEVQYEGQTYMFGDINNKNAKTIPINLNNGHFENTKNSTFGNNCMYDALADKIPELKAMISPKEFRKEIATTMRNDRDIIKEIQSPNKGYFMSIGFYGGMDRKRNLLETFKNEEPELPDSRKAFKTTDSDTVFNRQNTKNTADDDLSIDLVKLKIKPSEETKLKPNEEEVYTGKGFEVIQINGKHVKKTEFQFGQGSYKALGVLNVGRKNIAEVDHVLQWSVITEFNKKFGIIFTKESTPCIITPYLFHRMLLSTGSSEASKIFRAEQINRTLNGDAAGAIQMTLKDYRNVAIKFHNIVNNVDNARENYLQEQVNTFKERSLRKYEESTKTPKPKTSKKTKKSKILTPEEIEKVAIKVYEAKNKQLTKNIENSKGFDISSNKDEFMNKVKDSLNVFIDSIAKAKYPSNEKSQDSSDHKEQKEFLSVDKRRELKQLVSSFKTKI